MVTTALLKCGRHLSVGSGSEVLRQRWLKAKSLEYFFSHVAHRERACSHVGIVHFRRPPWCQTINWQDKEIRAYSRKYTPLLEILEVISNAFRKMPLPQNEVPGSSVFIIFYQSRKRKSISLYFVFPVCSKWGQPNPSTTAVNSCKMKFSQFSVQNLQLHDNC